MELFIFILEIIGTIAFVSSGAMTAIKKDMDILWLFIGKKYSMMLGAVIVIIIKLLAAIINGIFLKAKSMR